MESDPKNALPHGQGMPRARSLPTVRITVWILGLACLGALSVYLVRVYRPAQDRQSDVAPGPGSAGAPGTSAARSATHPRSGGTRPASARLSEFAKQALRAEPSAATRQTVNDLVNQDWAGGVLTEEQAAAWKQKLQQLIQQGDSAVPAIREFLARNVDSDFGDADRQALGYPSLRAAMIDALAQIGSPVAMAAMDEVLQSTADPREIAQLTMSLEKLDPGVFQQEALDATRQTLAMAAGGNLPGQDVAPLFEIFQQYGGADAAADLEHNADQWNYYAMIALAQLPDGAGIPTLVQVASGQAGAGAGARTAALEMLTQVATQSSDAQTALIDQVRQNRLSAYDWATLMPILAGNQMVFQNSYFGNTVNTINPNDLRKTTVSTGNQSFYTAPLGALTGDQIGQRLTLINQLLGATSDPSAVQILQQARAQLVQRMAQMANSPAQ